MSEFLESAAAELNEKLAGADIGGTVKFAIAGEGTIFVDDSGARVGDDEADVTLSADAETFKGIFDGEVNPTGAFMAGQLTVDGDMGLAMKLAGVLS
ncbi:MAG: SCP2 sterol-binding domain-containing protein [Rhodobacteraceae bacterium]|nr:SCP2 sterol-binding domain-containing protein [Paracoccaceae bacterium]